MHAVAIPHFKDISKIWRTCRSFKTYRRESTWWLFELNLTITRNQQQEKGTNNKYLQTCLMLYPSIKGSKVFTVTLVDLHVCWPLNMMQFREGREWKESVWNREEGKEEETVDTVDSLHFCWYTTPRCTSADWTFLNWKSVFKCSWFLLFVTLAFKNLFLVVIGFIFVSVV